MKKHAPQIHESKELINRLMLPQLNIMTLNELHIRFFNLGSQLDCCIDRAGTTEELNTIQLEIARVKDELYRRAYLTPEASFQKAYFSLFLAQTS